MTTYILNSEAPEPQPDLKNRIIHVNGDHLLFVDVLSRMERLATNPDGGKRMLLKNIDPPPHKQGEFCRLLACANQNNQQIHWRNCKVSERALHDWTNHYRIKK